MNQLAPAAMVRTGAVFGGAGTVALALGYFIGKTDYNLQAYVVVALAVALVAGLVIIPRMAASERRIFLWIVGAGLLAKAAASIFQLYWAFDVKAGIGDVAGYHFAGRALAADLRDLNFGQVASFFEVGTGFIDVMTGFLYAIIGPTLFGGALVFAFLAFVGSFFYYKAFRVAFPQDSALLYAPLVFLYPSLLYWPSLQGKDAPLVFSIGLFAYGLALLFRRGSLKAFVLLGLGLGGVSLIRPHIAAMLMLAAGVAFMIRPFKLRPFPIATRMAGLGLMVGLSWVAISTAADFLALESLSVDSTLAFYDKRLDIGFEGGAAYNPPSLTDPLGFPKQVMTVLFRPWPWEAHRMVALILSMEGLVLLGLSVYRISAIRKAFFSVGRNPYVTFILIYAIMFMFAYMTIGNFSILGRQRLMFLPFYFMLVASPKTLKVVRQGVPRRVSRFVPLRQGG